MFAREVLDEADKLGLKWYEHLALILVVALLSVVMRRVGSEAWDRLRKVEWSVEPAPQPISDGETAEDRDRPPALPVPPEQRTKDSSDGCG